MCEVIIGLGKHSVHPSFFLLVGVEPSTKFSKRKGLTGSQFLEGVAGKEGDEFFQGGLQFLHKE